MCKISEILPVSPLIKITTATERTSEREEKNLSYVAAKSQKKVSFNIIFQLELLVFKIILCRFVIIRGTLPAIYNTEQPCQQMRCDGKECSRCMF